MNAGTKLLRSLMLAGIMLGVVTVASAARAACVNDDDCPNAACGGDVCDYSTQPPQCKPAGTAAKGSDGWCTTNANCKCKALGATCAAVYCTFTKPSDAPAGTTGAAGSSTGAAGSSTGAAGSSTGAAGSSTGGAGTGSTGSGSSGGCSVSGSTSGGFAALAGLALVAGRLLRRRRRA